MFPVPEEVKPIKGLSLDQSYRVPSITEPIKLIGSALVLAQSICEAMLSIPGVGLTKILNTMGVPKQVLENGVTVICAEMGRVELLLVVKLFMFPEPMAGNPINVLVFVQLNTVPAIGEPVKLTGLVVLSPQTTWLGIASTLGIGSTVI
jgi:hypothetical protein